ncbi:MAG: hypothetical protein QOI17_1958, partial [Gaiellales bacterium]|nr:hypothetical protein [Gaiellales bacterium]
MRRRLIIPLLLITLCAGAGSFVSVAASAPSQSPDVHFGTQAVGTTSAPVQVTITNNGPDLNVTGFSFGGTNPGAFAAIASGDTCSGNLLAGGGGTCAVNVTFTPASAGQLSAQLQMTSDSGTSPDVVANVDGTGTAPSIAVTPLSPFDFGNHKVGDAPADSQAFTITNNGNANLTS